MISQGSAKCTMKHVDICRPLESSSWNFSCRFFFDLGIARTLAMYGRGLWRGANYWHYESHRQETQWPHQRSPTTDASGATVAASGRRRDIPLAMGMILIFRWYMYTHWYNEIPGLSVNFDRKKFIKVNSHEFSGQGRASVTVLMADFAEDWVLLQL